MTALLLGGALFAAVVGFTTWLLSTPAPPWTEGEDGSEEEPW